MCGRPTRIEPRVDVGNSSVAGGAHHQVELQARTTRSSYDPSRVVLLYDPKHLVRGVHEDTHQFRDARDEGVGRCNGWTCSPP